MAFEKKTFAPDAVAKARRLYEDTQTSLNEVAAGLGITRTTLASRAIEWGWTPRSAAKATKPSYRKSGRARRSVGSNKTGSGHGGQKGRKQKPNKPEPERARPERARPERARPEKASPEKAKPEIARPEKARRGIAKPAPTRPAPQPGEAMSPAALTARVQRFVERELDAIDQILGAIGAADAAEAERSARTLASLARALKEVMRLATPDEPADADDDDPVPRDLDEFRRELARRIEALAAGGAAETPGDGG